MSCGSDPPVGKYRWAHRICTRCQTLLAEVGAITVAGEQVRDNLEVPTCYPGIVYVDGEQFPPAEKKWASVSLRDGKVSISWVHVKTTRPGLWRPKRGEQVDQTVLDKLRFRLPERRPRLALAGIGCSGARPMVSAVTPYVQAKALFGRMFRTPAANEWGIGPRPGVWEWADRFVPLLLKGFTEDVSRMPLQEWLESMPPRRRRDLQRAAEMYERTGWRRQYGTFTAFVKTEMLPGFDKDEHGLVRMKAMLDRLIQGPHDCAHVIAGPYLKPKVRRLKQIWSIDSPIFYGSTSPEKLHRWLNERLLTNQGWYFWCDFSMFDNTHSRDSWSFMERLYAHAMNDKDFVRVLRCWLEPKGRCGPFRYQANVMNASGRDDTALANGILNGFATYVSLVAAWLNVPLLSVTVEMLVSCFNDIILSVTGDDSLGRIPNMSSQQAETFAQRVRANIAEFGFEAKFMMSRKLSDAVYLGMRPYPVRVAGQIHWFWGKTIGRATYKMGWVTMDKKRDIMAHVTGIADMHVLCSSHVPVLADLAHKIVELRVGRKRTPVVRDENKPWEWTLGAGAPYSRETLEAVADTYSVCRTSSNPTNPASVHVTTEDVIDLIDAIRAIKTLPCVLDHWLWRHMIWVDDL